MERKNNLIERSIDDNIFLTIPSFLYPHSAIVVSHDRFFLDRIATHILACEGDSKWHFFEGNYAEYEDNRISRLGDQSIKRIKYAPLVNA